MHKIFHWAKVVADNESFGDGQGYQRFKNLGSQSPTDGEEGGEGRETTASALPNRLHQPFSSRAEIHGNKDLAALHEYYE